MSPHHSGLGYAIGVQELGFLLGHFVAFISRTLMLFNSPAHQVTWLLSIHTAKLEGSTADVNCNPFLHPCHPQSSHIPRNSLSYHVQPFYGAKITLCTSLRHALNFPSTLSALCWSAFDLQGYARLSLKKKNVFPTEVSKHIISLYTVIRLHYWEQIAFWHVL